MTKGFVLFALSLFACQAGGPNPQPIEDLAIKDLANPADLSAASPDLSIDRCLECDPLTGAPHCTPSRCAGTGIGPYCCVGGQCSIAGEECVTKPCCYGFSCYAGACTFACTFAKKDM
jgi:hypothetical protein